MSHRLRLLLAALAGAGAAFGQQPYNLPVLMLLGIAAAVWLLRQEPMPKRAALIGWAFGFGYFCHALQWIVSPFMVDVARHGWMAPFALVFLAAGLALFWGVAFWGARRLSARNWPLILTLPAAELTRAYIFTGFPWAMPSQVTVDTLASRALALSGPYVVNLILVAAAVALVSKGGWRRRALPRVFAMIVALTLVLKATDLNVNVAIGEFYFPDGDRERPVIRLIQPNASQRDKWDPVKIPVFFERQLQYTAAPPSDPAKPPALTIWSETAIPWRLDLAGTALEEIAKAGGETPVTLGVQRSDALRYFNSMVVLDAQGTPAQVYDKHHLVPFGEYMPLGDLLANFGIYGLAARAGHGYSAGPGAKLLDFGPLGKALPLICYEAVFAHDVNAATERPDFLIQITNDAWFGKGAGPKQHLAQARMRAIEQGLPLARSANTGISAMIDPYGRITASLPLNTAGFLDAKLPKPLPPTLYSRTGDLPFAALLVLALGAAMLRARASKLQ